MIPSEAKGKQRERVELRGLGGGGPSCTRPRRRGREGRGEGRGEGRHPWAGPWLSRNRFPVAVSRSWEVRRTPSVRFLGYCPNDLRLLA